MKLFRMLGCTLLIASLPLQGMAAAVMPACPYGGKTAISIQMQAMNGHCPHEQAADEREVPQAGAATAMCGDCGTCCNFCSISISSLPLVTGAMPPAIDPQVFASFHVLQFVPEQPQRPPRA